MTNNALFESDGISEEFFALLHSKDDLNFGPSINIPDTVVFKHGIPTNWYFTSTNGRIKRKNNDNLLNKKIEEAFTKHIIGYDVLATFISFPEESRSHSDNNNQTSTIEYLDKKTLHDFLYKPKERKNGILQRFIEPKGTKNDIIRAIWSPKICVLERSENIYHLHDQRFGLYERCVTYEGPEYFFTSSIVRGAVLAGQIQKICEAIVSHISEVTYAQKQLSRIVVNLKVDSRDKLWLLFTTSIRCHSNSLGSNYEFNEGNINTLNLNSVFSLPDTINLNPIKSYDEIAVRKPKMRIRCVSCSEETLDETRHPVNYKSVVKHYEHVLHLLHDVSISNSRRNKTNNLKAVMISWPPDIDIISATGGVGFGCLDLIKDDEISHTKIISVDIHNDKTILKIPPILRYLHPKLNAVSYERCRKDPLFLYKTVTVCESCFLVYAEFTTMLLRMGQNITSFLKSDNFTASKLNENSSSTRPSSADWRAMTSIHIKSKSEYSDGMQSSPSVSPFYPSDNHNNALDSAIGIRTSDTRKQPGVPIPIRRSEDTNQIHAQLTNGLFSNSTFDNTSQSNLNKSINILLDSKLSRDDNDIITKNAVEREKTFLKELSRNPQLRDQHPLMHLITAQQKLLQHTKESGAFQVNSSSEKQLDLYGSGYGKQSENNIAQVDKYSTYKEELPYLKNGVHVLPSKLKQIKTQEKQIQVKNKLKLLESDNNDTSINASDSSHSHSNFLKNALKTIESDF